MHYTLTITDNRTGETVRKAEFNALFAGVSFGERKVGAIGIVEGKGADVIAAATGAYKAIDDYAENEPDFKRVFKTARRFVKKGALNEY